MIELPSGIFVWANAANRRKFDCMAPTQTAREPKAPRPKMQAEAPARTAATWLRSPFALSFLASGLYWASLPPIGWRPLAWLAPIPWLMLARQPRLPGGRPYLQLWLSGFVFWLIELYWLTLPHWATGFGLLALACYLAFYWPAFVGLLRVAVHQAKLPLMIAAPVVWTGLELARAHLIGGFLLSALGHSQYEWLALIQVSDLAGAYGVSFLIVLGAACVVETWTARGLRRLVPAGIFAIAMAATLGYGHYRLNQDTLSPGPKIALIQGSIDTELKSDPSQTRSIYDHYMQLSVDALRGQQDVDLVVWPETMFRYSWYTFAPDYQKPPDVEWTPAELEDNSRTAVRATAELLGAPLLLGIDSVHEGRNLTERYNSALFADAKGKILGRYDKVHLVMFGEFVPLASRFPWLYRLTPLPGGIDAGTGPRSVKVGKYGYAPNICFESTVPHLVRSQVAELRQRGEEPDVLVNLTNDGWFWGSSELDLHLICGVFRAIECRKPFMIAANTGFSAWIESTGSIVAQGPRRAAGTIMARPNLDHRQSLYLAWGDTPAGMCLAACIGLAGWGWYARRRDRHVAG